MNQDIGKPMGSIVAGIADAYMSGFGNSFESEALAGALPIGRNSPQRAPYGLYAEQLSGSPFTAPRGANERSWLYRIRPSVRHSGRFQKFDAGLWRTAPCLEHDLPIGQLRWDPAPIPSGDVTFTGDFETFHVFAFFCIQGAFEIPLGGTPAASTTPAGSGTVQ